jgi:hypothetical protein
MVVLTNVIAALTSLRHVVETQRDEIIFLKEENSKLKEEGAKAPPMEYAEVVKKKSDEIIQRHDHLQQIKGKERFEKDLNLAARTVKIVNFPIVDEKLVDSANDKFNQHRAKELISNNQTVSNNYLRRATIIPLLKKGDTIKKLREKGTKELPVLVQCLDKDGKNALMKDIKDDSERNFDVRNHHEQELFKKIRVFREKLKTTPFTTDGKKMDLTTMNSPQISIRPNSENSWLNVSVREGMNGNWNHLCSLTFKFLEGTYGDPVIKGIQWEK